MVVESTLIRSQLLAPILQTVHPHMLVEPQLIRAMLALHLPVMMRGRNLDPMMLYVLVKIVCPRAKPLADGARQREKGVENVVLPGIARIAQYALFGRKDILSLPP